MRKELFFILVAMCLVMINLPAQDAYTALFQTQSAPTRYFEQVSWEEILEKQQTLQLEGFQLSDIETIFNQQQQFYWGLWSKDTSHTLVEKVAGWPEFIAKKKAMSAKGYLLHDVEGYTDQAGAEYFIGIWRRGEREHEVVKLSSWKAVDMVGEQFRKKNLYPQDVEICKSGRGSSFFLVLYYRGTPDDRTYLVAANDKATFNTEHLHRFKSGYRLKDFESSGSLFMGIFRSGGGQESLQYYINGDSFAAYRSYEQEDNQLFLSDIEVYEGNGMNRLPVSKEVRP